jgi:uncharacterized glyoxalase superfamily protein PhnB
MTKPSQKTFRVEAFGKLVDRFGAPWMINGGQASARRDPFNTAQEEA